MLPTIPSDKPIVIGTAKKTITPLLGLSFSFQVFGSGSEFVANRVCEVLSFLRGLSFLRFQDLGLCPWWLFQKVWGTRSISYPRKFLVLSNSPQLIWSSPLDKLHRRIEGNQNTLWGSWLSFPPFVSSSRRTRFVTRRHLFFHLDTGTSS